MLLQFRPPVFQAPPDVLVHFHTPEAFRTPTHSYFQANAEVGDLVCSVFESLRG